MMRVHDPVGGLQDASSWAVGLKNISLAQKKGHGALIVPLHQIRSEIV